MLNIHAMGNTDPNLESLYTHFIPNMQTGTHRTDPSRIQQGPLGPWYTSQGLLLGLGCVSGSMDSSGIDRGVDVQVAKSVTVSQQGSYELLPLYKGHKKPALTTKAVIFGGSCRKVPYRSHRESTKMMVFE